MSSFRYSIHFSVNYGKALKPVGDLVDSVNREMSETFHVDQQLVLRGELFTLKVDSKAELEEEQVDLIVSIALKLLKERFPDFEVEYERYDVEPIQGEESSESGPSFDTTCGLKPKQ